MYHFIKSEKSFNINTLIIKVLYGVLFVSDQLEWTRG